jgi:hypothetical protein
VMIAVLCFVVGPAGRPDHETQHLKSVKVHSLFQNIFTRLRAYKCSRSLGPQTSTY